MISLDDWYAAPGLQSYVDFRGTVGGGATTIEARQPPGDFSTPPVRDLQLIQPLSPGIRLTKRWGTSRFSGVAPLGSQWLVPAECKVDLVVDTPHTIRMLALDPAHVPAAVDGAVTARDLEELHRGPFFDATLRALMSAIWNATAPTAGADPMRTEELIVALVAELGRVVQRPPPPARGGLSPRHARTARELLASGAGTGVSIARLAREVGLSPYHFARAFKVTFGVAPHRYQKLSRLHRARELLASRRLTILQVALAVGYSSAESLARLFRAEMGISPQGYRRSVWGRGIAQDRTGRPGSRPYMLGR